jgi:hypothetical protein
MSPSQTTPSAAELRDAQALALEPHRVRRPADLLRQFRIGHFSE